MANGLMKDGGFSPGKLFWLYWFPLIIYCLAIFIQSSFPSPQRLPSFPYSDKVMHFAAYGIMGGLFSRALKVGWSSLRPFHIISLSTLFTTLYGIGDEIHQLFVMGRTADPMDVFADFLGGIFGAACFCVVTGLFGRRKALRR